MTIFYPYVLLETNVDPKLLKYTIYIYNTVRDVDELYSIGPYVFRKVENNLYQTKSIEVNTSKIKLEDIRDCVISFSLHRANTANKQGVVLSRQITPNKIELFISPNNGENKGVRKIKYNETVSGTKVVKVDKSKNTFELNLKRNRIFQCIDTGCRPGESKDPFSKRQVEASLQSRLNEPLPDQKLSSLCGPAVYFFCLINLSPSKYKTVVKQLWETGETTVGTLKIKPSINGCRKVTKFYKEDGIAKIPPIDWITLASLRESENLAILLNNPSLEIPGITTWSEVSRWFERSEFKVVKKIPFSLTGYSPNLIYELNQYITSNHYVVTLINAALLSGGASSGTEIFPDHWIVWTDQLRDTTGKVIDGEIGMDPNTIEVRLKAFSWGENKQQLGAKKTLYEFGKRVFFALVVKKEIF